MSFGKTKDRIWVTYDVIAKWLARQPLWIRRIGFSIFGLVLWIAYLLPGNIVRPTYKALARHVGAPSPWRLFAKFTRGFCCGLDRMEQVRHGHTDAIDAMLRIPDEDRLKDILKKGGCVLALPHTHSTFSMGRGLAQRHPMLAIVRSSAGDQRRTSSELQICANLGCEFLDVQQEKPATVARKILSALKNGQIVVAAVDRITHAPPAEAPVDASNDTMRASAFGQPVGIKGWPARFALKAGVPIVPATIVQTKDAVTLCLGEGIDPSEDLLDTTQRWVDELEKLLRQHPEEWVFALDKHWSKTLRAP